VSTSFRSAWRSIASSSHPLLFATVSGAHLYGFPSPDSDFDLRGLRLAREALNALLLRIRRKSEGFTR
jgi:predicted nucleotidyltransferase